jgi:hypothetical protein
VVEKEIQNESREMLQESLDSIEKMEQAALKRVVPPLWFGASIALLAGALVALSAAGLREYHVYIILLMVLVLVGKSKNLGVSVRKNHSKLTVIALCILIPLFFMLVAGAQAISGMLGNVWAPLSAGGILSAAVFVLSLFERRCTIIRVGVEQGE